MPSPVQVTVVVCTYNRAATLPKALESVAAQTLPPSVPWEVLVVDNNSGDGTRQVVEDFQRRYPGRFRYLLEPQQGVSYARNAGFRDAQGEIVAYIDDDETAAVDWLQNLTAELHGGEWVGAGGRIVSQWNCSRPPWLSDDNSFTTAPLAAFDLDTEQRELTEPPFTANVAFRKEIFGKIGGFRTDLGRSGKNLVSNEDTEFGRRVFAAGGRLRYEPSAVTYHPVEAYRLRRAYFLAWWFNKGRSDVREIGVQPVGTHLLGIPLRLFRHVAVQVLRWTFALEPSRRFICKLKVWAIVGEAYESFCQAIDAKRKGRERNSGDRSPADEMSR